MAERRPMKLRTRLVLSFVYLLLAVVLALTIPLAVSLADQGRPTWRRRPCRTRRRWPPMSTSPCSAIRSGSRR